MFDHPNFDRYSFEEVPLDRDIYLMGEEWASEYERNFLNVFAGGSDENIGYISCAAARAISVRIF